jgi:ubiquinone/menaquinone biosynthesis C-methylase UbiE
MDLSNLGHYLIGMEGLAILRTWLTGPKENVDARICELTKFVSVPTQAPLSIELQVPEKDLHEGYAAWAATYDSLPNPLIRLEEPVVQALIAPLPPGDALDAACGTGRHTAYLVSQGHRVVGVDTSVGMLEKARAKLPTVDLRTGDLSALPLETGSMDLAICTLALTHCADLGLPMNELARVVRPGGRVILSDQHPTMTVLGAQAFFVAGDGSFAYVANYFHPHSAYLAAFETAGLAVQQCMEPTYGHDEIRLMAGGLLGIASEAFRTALLGVPGALVWELVRRE